MTIARSSIKDFFSRDLLDFRTLKDSKDTWVDGELAKLNPQPVFRTDPYLHQKICFLIGNEFPQFLNMLDMGLGKSKLMLDLFFYFMATKRARKMLVLCNTTSLVESWLMEVEKHTPWLTASRIAKSEDFLRSHDLNDDVCVTTYQGWMHFVCDKVKKKGEKVNKMVINHGRLKHLCLTFDFVVYDESTALKNHRSLYSKIARKMLKLVKTRFALTGTPHGRNPEDLWNQFFVIDGGETLGDSLGIFREAFFDAKDNYWTGWPSYKFRKDMADELNRMMANRSIYFASEECLDLPAKVYVKHPIVMPSEASAYYEKVVNEVQAAGGHLAKLDGAFIKMRQILSGFVHFKDEDEDRKEIVFDENPRLEELVDLINAIDERKKVVVFLEFVLSGELISNALKEVRIGHERLYSGTKDKKRVLERFNSDKRCRVLIVNNQSGALGLNLQVANYVIFYESPVSPIVRQQAEKRCHRIGQKEKVFYYDLVVKKSIDEKILKYVQEGKDLFAAIVRGEESLT
jgi:SNF2 family DNA or RNA helicase